MIRQQTITIIMQIHQNLNIEKYIREYDEIEFMPFIFPISEY